MSPATGRIFLLQAVSHPDRQDDRDNITLYE